MNKLEIYVSTLFANSIGFLFNLLIFVVFFNLFEGRFAGLSFYNLWIVALFINLFVLALGISLILSNIYIIAKDINQVWMVVTAFLFFLSPIFYKLSTFNEKLPGFQYLNPLAGIIINARRVMMDRQPPTYRIMAFDFTYAFVILIIGLILLNKLGAKAAEKL
jgi:ABC-type polysaccharide/polyol phosphate export permease